MQNRVFHSIKIRGLEFEGLVGTDGPTLWCKRGGVALVISSLRDFLPERHSHRKDARAGWWVIKYTHEARIDLTDFEAGDIRRLSAEFGLCIMHEGDPRPLDPIRTHTFLTSPAWAGLRRWVAAHPRLARNHAEHDLYLPGWLSRALAQNEHISRTTDPLTRH